MPIPEELSKTLAKAEERIRSLTSHNEELLHTLSKLDEDHANQYRDRRRLRALIENAPMCVHEIGLDGNVQSMNPKGLAMLDTTEVVGTQYLDSVGEDDYPRIEQLMKEAFAGQSSEFEFVASDPSLKRTFTSCFVPIYDEVGNVERLMGCTREITNQLAVKAAHQNLQEQVLHVQKLESLGLLASGVAHDFNNMLAAIMGNVEIAKLQIGRDHEAIESLESAQSAVDLGANLCKQLLAYAGKGRFEIQPMQLGNAAHKVLSMLRATLPPNADIVTQLSEVTVDASAGQIDQIILNLLMNATEALGGEPGRVILTIETVTLCAGDFVASVGGDLRAGTYAHLSVDDEGRGIPLEALPCIFDPFFSTKDSGRGLGLAAVGGIVRSHNGYLRVHTTEGKGTRFSIYLPTTDKPPVFSKIHETLRADGKCILVVDDDDRVRKSSAQLLVARGFETMEARDGFEALALLRSDAEKITAVLLDVTMPGLSGPQVLEKLREFSPAMPVVLCSGWERCEVDTSALKRTAFLSKPYSLEALTSALATVLESEK
jgi:two-component system cell cycle sensor histidine kinase/response regulator CckA